MPTTTEGEAGVGLRERITTDLARRILSGAYPEGAAIPTEGALMVELNVSRTVLRESVRTLAAKGLLETRQRAGTLVPPRADWHLLDPDILKWIGTVEPDAKFVLDLTEARKVIEPAAAALAARVGSLRDLAAVEDAYAAMRATAPADLDASIAADLDFHLGILRASGNAIFASLGEVVSAAMLCVFRMTTTASANYAATLDAHGDVLEAIRMRRPAEARERMEQLLEIAANDLVRTLDADAARRDAH